LTGGRFIQGAIDRGDQNQGASDRGGAIDLDSKIVITARPFGHSSMINSYDSSVGLSALQSANIQAEIGLHNHTVGNNF